MKGIYEACYYGGLAMTIFFVILAIVFFVVFKIPKVIGELTGISAKKAMKTMGESEDNESTITKKERAKYYNEDPGKIKVRQAFSGEKKKHNKSDRNANAEVTDVLSNDGIGSQETEVLSDNVSSESDGVKFREFKDNTSKQARSIYGDMGETAVLAGSIGDEGATEVLSSGAGDEGATEVLSTVIGDEGATEVLSTVIGDEGATEVLSTVIGDEGATDVLKSTTENETNVDSTTILKTNSVTALAGKVKVLYNVLEIHTNEKI